MRFTTIEEMQAFLGLMLYRGLYNLNTFLYKRLFSEQNGPPIFSATMSCFRFLVRCFCFDNEATRAQRWQRDRFAATRKLLELFNEQCMSCLQAIDFISLDETLYRMRNQIGITPISRLNTGWCSNP